MHSDGTAECRQGKPRGGMNKEKLLMLGAVGSEHSEAVKVPIPFYLLSSCPVPAKSRNYQRLTHCKGHLYGQVEPVPPAQGACGPEIGQARIPQML